MYIINFSNHSFSFSIKLFPNGLIQLFYHNVYSFEVIKPIMEEKKLEYLYSPQSFYTGLRAPRDYTFVSEYGQLIGFKWGTTYNGAYPDPVDVKTAEMIEFCVLPEVLCPTQYYFNINGKMCPIF